MRSRLCGLKSYGLTYARIHAVHPEIPISTIKTTVRRERLRLDNVSRPRSGAPRKLTEVQRDEIYDIVNFQNPHVKYRDLLDSVDHVVKERSIQRLLRELDKRKWLQRKRPVLTENHAAARLRWAQEYQDYEEEDWKKVKWSDECTVERGVGVQPIWTFNRPSEQLLQHDVHAVRPSGRGVRQMLWAGFGHSCRTSLVALYRDPLAARGGVSGRSIEALYTAMLPTFIQQGDIFMHNNAPVHRARIVTGLLNRLGITVIEWPPYSPDLNPIENL
jgi:transposase